MVSAIELGPVRSIALIFCALIWSSVSTPVSAEEDAEEAEQVQNEREQNFVDDAEERGRDTSPNRIQKNLEFLRNPSKSFRRLQDEHMQDTQRGAERLLEDE